MGWGVSQPMALNLGQHWKLGHRKSACLLLSLSPLGCRLGATLASTTQPLLSDLGHCTSTPIRTTCLLFSSQEMDTLGVGTVSPFTLGGSRRQGLYLSRQIGLPGQGLSLPQQTDLHLRQRSRLPQQIPPPSASAPVVCRSQQL